MSSPHALVAVALPPDAGATTPLYLRGIDDGTLVCRPLSRDASGQVVVDLARPIERASIVASGGLVADVTLAAGASLAVDLVRRRQLVTPSSYAEVDRSQPFRIVARQCAQLDYAREDVPMIDLEVWYLLPGAAQLFAETSPSALPWSYESRVASALEAVTSSSGSRDMLELIARTWASHWLADDVDPASLEPLGREVLPRVADRLGHERYAQALRAGADEVARSREPYFTVLTNVGGQRERFRATMLALVAELGHHHGVVLDHTLVDATLEGHHVDHWRSADLELSFVTSQAEQLSVVRGASPRGLQLALVRDLGRTMFSRVKGDAEGQTVAPATIERFVAHATGVVEKALAEAR